MIPEFYTRRPEWSDRIERIGELIGRVTMSLGRATPYRAATIGRSTVRP